MGNFSSSVVWSVLVNVVETGVCLLALYRGLWRRLPLFTSYLAILTAAEWLRFGVWIHAGVNSRAYSWAYWLSQDVLVLARAAALADVCRAALRPYGGVWQLARALLAGAAVALGGVAAVRTAGLPGFAPFFIFAERELEVAIVVTLVVLLMVSRYYGVALERPLGAITLGLAFYSSVIILNNSVLLGPLALPWSVYGVVRIVAFVVALAAWALALRLPLPQAAYPALTSEAQFEAASSMVDQRMRELNSRLLQLMKR